jgi:hypothetical protein
MTIRKNRLTIRSDFRNKRFIRYLATWADAGFKTGEPSEHKHFALADARLVDDHYVLSLAHINPEDTEYRNPYTPMLTLKSDYEEHISPEHRRVVGVEHDQDAADQRLHSLILREVKQREARRKNTKLVDLEKRI